jgi:hypothetical protein
MPRFLCLILVLAAAAVPLLGAAVAGADSGSDYVKYAKVRDRVSACVVDSRWRQLSGDRRHQCATSYRKLYRLWTQPGQSNGFHVRCLTSTCPPQPFGEPDPHAAIPAGAKVFRP